MNSLSVNCRGISFLSTVKQWLLQAQIYCTSYALADENTSLRTLEAEAGLFPAVSMLWAIRRKDLHFLSVYVFVRLSNPHSSLRDSACQLWSLSEKTVFASGHHYPPELSSTADANYRKKSWKFTRHCVFFCFFSHLWLQQRWRATAREDTYSGESAWDQLKPLDWFQGVAGGGNKTNNKSKKTLIRIFRNIFWALSEGLTGLLTRN